MEGFLGGLTLYCLLRCHRKSKITRKQLIYQLLLLSFTTWPELVKVSWLLSWCCWKEKKNKWWDRSLKPVRNIDCWKKEIKCSIFLLYWFDKKNCCSMISFFGFFFFFFCQPKVSSQAKDDPTRENKMMFLSGILSRNNSQYPIGFGLLVHDSYSIFDFSFFFNQPINSWVF